MSEHTTVGSGQRRPGVRSTLGVLFGVTFLGALLPPVYIGATKLHDVLFGVPLSIWYLFLIAGAAVALCVVLYFYESSREELD